MSSGSCNRLPSTPLHPPAIKPASAVLRCCHPGLPPLKPLPAPSPPPPDSRSNRHGRSCRWPSAARGSPPWPAVRECGRAEQVRMCCILARNAQQPPPHCCHAHLHADAALGALWLRWRWWRRWRRPQLLQKHLLDGRQLRWRRQRGTWPLDATRGCPLHCAAHYLQVCIGRRVAREVYDVGSTPIAAPAAAPSLLLLLLPAVPLCWHRLRLRRPRASPTRGTLQCRGRQVCLKRWCVWRCSQKCSSWRQASRQTDFFPPASSLATNVPVQAASSRHRCQEPPPLAPPAAVSEWAVE